MDGGGRGGPGMDGGLSWMGIGSGRGCVDGILPEKRGGVCPSGGRAGLVVRWGQLHIGPGGRALQGCSRLGTQLDLYSSPPQAEM